MNQRRPEGKGTLEVAGVVMIVTEAQTTIMPAKVAARESLLDLGHKSLTSWAKDLIACEGILRQETACTIGGHEAVVSISTEAPTDAIHAICAAREYLLDVAEPACPRS